MKRAFIIVVSALLVSHLLADIPFFWLDSPSGRSNPHDPARTVGSPPTAPSTSGPTPTPTSIPCDTSGYSASWGGSLPGQLVSISNVEYADNGDIYAVDSELSKVVRFSSSGAFLNEWGRFGTGPGEFDDPVGLAWLSGTVHVSDTYNYRVQRFFPDGTYLGAAAGLVFMPRQIWVAPTGRIHGLDYNWRVWGVEPNGSGYGYFGSYGAGPGQLNNMADLRVDWAQGQVHVADPNRIQRFTLAGAYLSQITVGAKALDADSGGRMIAVLGTSLRYYDAGGGLVATHSLPVNVNKISRGPGDELVVCGLQSGAQTGQLYRLQADGTLIQQWGLSFDQPGQVRLPKGCAVSGGAFYAVDGGNHRVNKYDKSGAFLASWGGYGFSGALLYNPTGMALDVAENVYVVDQGNIRIVKYSNSGALLLAFGTNGTGVGQLQFPTAVSVRGNGDVLVADASRDKVLRYDASGTFLDEFGVSGALAGQLQWPSSLLVLANGDILVGDSQNNCIQRYSSTGSFLGNFASGIQPIGLALAPSGGVVMTGRDSQIRYFNASGSLTRIRGCRGGLPGEYNYPDGIAADGSHIFVSDTENYRIQKLVL